MKKPRITQSANKLRKSLIPTPNLLNKSDPSVLLSESFAAYFPKKCNKNLPKSPTKPNIFEKLSDEVIVKIFSYISHVNLSRVSLVCHRFRRIGEYIHIQILIIIFEVYDKLIKIFLIFF